MTKDDVRVAMSPETQNLLSLLEDLTGYSRHQLLHELICMGASIFVNRWPSVRSAQRGGYAQRIASLSRLRGGRAHWLSHLFSGPAFALGYARKSRNELRHTHAETIAYLNSRRFKTADGKDFAKSTVGRLLHPHTRPRPETRALDLVLALAAARAGRQLNHREQRRITTAWKQAKRRSRELLRPVRKAIDVLWRPYLDRTRRTR